MIFFEKGATILSKQAKVKKEKCLMRLKAPVRARIVDPHCILRKCVDKCPPYIASEADFGFTQVPHVHFQDADEEGPIVVTKKPRRSRPIPAGTPMTVHASSLSVESDTAETRVKEHMSAMSARVKTLYEQLYSADSDDMIDDLIPILSSALKRRSQFKRKWEDLQRAMDEWHEEETSINL